MVLTEIKSDVLDQLKSYKKRCKIIGSDSKVIEYLLERCKQLEEENRRLRDELRITFDMIKKNVEERKEEKGYGKLQPFP